MTDSLDEMFEQADDIGTGGGDFPQYERALLSESQRTLRVRLVGGWKDFFEAWCEQQPVAGVKPESIGKPRRLVIKGYVRDAASGAMIIQDPYTERIFSFKGSTDPENLKWFNDAKPTKFFAFNCIPVNVDVGGVDTLDTWCVQNKHCKILATNKNGYGIKSKLFKAIADAMKVHRAYYPDVKLDQVDLILTRQGTGFDTNYGCQISPRHANIDVAQFERYDLNEFTELTPIAMVEKYTGFNLGGVVQAQAPIVTTSAPAVAPQVSRPAQSQQPVVAATTQPAQRVSLPVQQTQAAVQPAVARPQVQTMPTAGAASSPLAVSQVARPVVEPIKGPDPQACPHCGNAVMIPDSLKGMEVNCPHCKQTFSSTPF